MTDPVRIEVGRRFGVSVQDGFDYITDLANWPDYWPGLIRVERGSRWREPGDRARIVLRLLGRRVKLEMTIRRIVPYRLVEYTSVQRGLPDARHERHFANAGGELDYRLAVEFEPRPGWRGQFDRAVFSRAVERAMRNTLSNLETRFSLPPFDRRGAGTAGRNGARTDIRSPR